MIISDAIIVLCFIFAFLSMSSMVFESLHLGHGYFFFKFECAKLHTTDILNGRMILKVFLKSNVVNKVLISYHIWRL